MHVDEVELVVHVDPRPSTRPICTAPGAPRAGRAGAVVTVVLPEQRKDFSALMRKAGINVRPQQVTAHCEPVTTLVGDVAAYQAPAPKATPGSRAGAIRARGADPRAAAAAQVGSGVANLALTYALAYPISARHDIDNPLAMPHDGHRFAGILT